MDKRDLSPRSGISALWNEVVLFVLESSITSNPEKNLNVKNVFDKPRVWLRRFSTCQGCAQRLSPPLPLPPL